MNKNINVDNLTPIVSECWNFCRLAAILGSGNYEWYYMHFWDINLYDGFIAYYYEPTPGRWAMPEYDEILESVRLCSTSQIVPQIENTIDKGGFVILFIKSEKKAIYEHEILVYGYNSNDKVINSLVYVGQPDYWEKTEYSYSEIEGSFKDEVDELSNNDDKLLFYWTLGYPASAFYFKKKINTVDFNLLYQTVRRMLYSGCQGATGVKLYYSEDERWLNVHRGIEIYKMFYVTLYDLLKKDVSYINENPNVIHSTYKLYESKKKIKYTLQQLTIKKYIAGINDLISQVGKLCDNLRIGLSLLEKIYISKSNKSLDNFKKIFQEAELLDKCILEQLLIIFKGEVKRDFLGDCIGATKQKTKENKQCRYITYEIQTDQNYVKSYLHEYVLLENKAFIIGVSDKEEQVIHLGYEVAIQIDSWIDKEYNHFDSGKSRITIGRPRNIREDEVSIVSSLYRGKYHKNLNGEKILCIE